MNAQIMKTDFHGDWNIGLFGFSTERFCLVSNRVDDKDVKILRDSLKVPVIRMSYGFAGIFIAGNSNGILLPEYMENARKELEELGCEVSVLKSKYTALGNLILSNDKGAIVSKLFGKKEIEEIASSLGVTVEKGTIARTNLPGSAGFATNKGVLLHRDTTDEENEHVKEILGVNSNAGTANFGSPWVGACIIGNTRGLFVGSKTTIHEIVRMDEVFNQQR
jgi:translation initiation factor 6